MAEKQGRILVVDDDTQIRMTVATHLGKRGYTVDVACDGAEALEKAALSAPNLVLLDLELGGMDGFAVLGRLREWTQTPVIIVSAFPGDREKIRALDLGADDYMTKPFSIDELLARVRANLRRAETLPGASDGAAELELGRICVNLAKHQVSVEGREVRLTPIEWSVLRELAGNVDKVVSHSQLLERVWGADYPLQNDSVRTSIKQLRKKLEADPSRPQYILTEPGMGYRLRTRRES